MSVAIPSSSSNLQIGSSASGFDEEDDIDERQYKGKEDYMTDKRLQEQAMKEAVKAHKQWENTIAKCYYCYNSETMPKDNVMQETYSSTEELVLLAITRT